MHVDCCCNELTIVDSLVLCEVQLLDDCLNFFLTHLEVGISDDLLQLSDLEEATMIRVNLLELLLELLDLIGLQMLDEYVYCCSLEERLTSVRLHSLHYVAVQFMLVRLRHRSHHRLVIDYFEPLM